MKVAPPDTEKSAIKAEYVLSISPPPVVAASPLGPPNPVQGELQVMNQRLLAKHDTEPK